IPIAAVGKYKVIGVDYRLSPDVAFPAANEDVAAGYRELLKTYKPQNIGLYGCSAGSFLTAESVPWFSKEGLPEPGAVGMVCGGAFYWTEGDAGIVNREVTGINAGSAQASPYFRGVDANNPLAFPGRDPKVLATFPPSLLVSGTRDFGLSSAV